MSTTATSNLAMAMIIDHVKAQYIQIPQQYSNNIPTY